MNQKMLRYSLGCLLLNIFLGLEALLAGGLTAKELELQIGIIQRLGAQPIDQQDLTVEGVKINSTPGELLEVDLGEDVNPKPITTAEIVIQVEPKPLTKPFLSENLVLSDRSTFETAEASANSWKKLGIEVEILQPGRWQVWAKRDVYSTPLVRRWLLHSLQANGYHRPYLDREVLNHRPQATLLINGHQYNLDRVEISASNNRVQVTSQHSDQTTTTYTYGGSLRLQPNAFGNYTLVNQVPLETYLRGVVPYEIGANAPTQAIAAQTIIARTYALRNLRRFQADDYQLCATVHCQVYKGLSGSNLKSDQAISATAGLVLTYKNELVDALYSSTTGGVTASFGDIWQGAERPYLKPIIDAPQPIWDLERYPLASENILRRFLSLKQGFNETGRSVFRWRKVRTIKELNQDLRRYLRRIKHSLVNFTTIEAINIQRRSPSGRILDTVITTDLGIVQLSKNEVRSAFEPPRSTLFYLEPIYNDAQQLEAYAFIGGGFGHGVGLSQYGARNLAKLGWTPRQILAFYYPETKIQPLNDSLIFWQAPNF